MVKAVIIGTGAHAQGLSNLFTLNNTEGSGNSLVVTKKQGIKVGDSFHDTDVSLADFDDALATAEIVILAIPAKALKFFVADNYNVLKSKILVDATNSSCASGDDLNTLLSVTDVRFVKAFNDIGAVDALTRMAGGKKKIPTALCSPCTEAIETVKSFGETSLGLDVKIVPYGKYSELAKKQDSLGDEWILSTAIMLVMFALCMTYNIVRHPVIKGYPWRQFPLFVMNKGISWNALYGFAVSQIPGILARMYDAYYRDTLRAKPNWLLKFLKIRKHLGLISLWFLSVHMWMSMLMFSIAYYSRFFHDKSDPMSRMSANGESSFMFGSIGASLYIILGICSLPSIAEQMTNKQWQFVYGPVAWSALACGTAHVMCQGVGVTWNNKEGWAGGLPPITLVSTCFPLFVLFMKLVQVIFVIVMDITHKGAYAKKYGDMKRESPSLDKGTDSEPSYEKGIDPELVTEGSKLNSLIA
mmetsp:Transcript_5699/g.8039  ORF Transcript_5699/g.8039 Transcript_5699/m.8039 type:complete len:471 (-) Transcript_5699:210-1622(-)|eukprot:CAMPEP_0194043656 /NCGR_PEP_ID=MMETSP0009_2-20130614/15249_1 /TAXON_ID=210454 /ORGANISM="Grammatophora oceanica, Strain CCMP 410" /LENGTH=470 /DNA_ID=CAMNT_0038687939 /DNA_START=246 /DNA_END=1658 /DNA_ORIENTATION=+